MQVLKKKIIMLRILLTMCRCKTRDWIVPSKKEARVFLWQKGVLYSCSLSSNQKGSFFHFSPLAVLLNCYFTFLCSDLEIAQGQTPKDISEVANEIGLQPREVNILLSLQMYCIHLVNASMDDIVQFIGTHN